jgi:hypothetical protein
MLYTNKKTPSRRMTDGVGFALAISVWLTMKIAGHCQWCGVFPSILPPDFAFDPVMSSKKFQKKGQLSTEPE